MLNGVDYFDYAAGKFVTILDGKEVTVTTNTFVSQTNSSSPEQKAFLSDFTNDCRFDRLGQKLTVRARAIVK